MSRVSTFLLMLVVAVLALGGCKTESYCFENCEPFTAAGGTNGGGNTGGVGADINLPSGGSGGAMCIGFGCEGTGAADGGECVQTNEGVEACDGLDNDCDGETDEDIDFSSPTSCGNCDVDCTETLTRVAIPKCNPSATPGVDPGTCDYEGCAADWYDADGDRENGCEYYCQWNPDGNNTTDPGGAEGCGRDDDCDGNTDEDVDVCADVDNCGECGFRCSMPNANPTCETTAGSGEACTRTNTKCVIDTCADGYFDVDGSADNGCEYACTLSNGGVETCDGEDNDCDGLIDNTDPDLEDDPAIGAPCYGSDKGACADSAVAGVQKCIAGAISCCDVDSNTLDSLNDPRLPNASIRNGMCRGNVGPFVLFPDVNSETCNGIDDDCDGVVDDTPTDAGGVCGNNVGQCQTGLEQCVSGVLTCVGALGPSDDVCDGLDNDCDGVIDGVRVTGGGVACNSDADCSGQGANALCLPVSTNGNLKECVARATDTADSNGGALACDVPPPPPSGIPQPCSPGTLRCFGGVKTCVGSVKATVTTDACNEDSNCDGQLTNQTGRLDDDVNNCGTCGNDCTAATGNATWTCANGSCTTSGCQAGYVECGGLQNNDCETACQPDPGGEICDGIDNDCDCQTDEGIPAPTVYQACGVNPAATDGGCTTQVTITCSNGGWICAFPNGYCPGGDCSAAVERCDGLDNNCDGQIDENFSPPLLNSGYLGASCKSDDGLPPPGHGDCQTTGVYVCSADQLGTTCSATKDLSRATNELCDGVDNDCDGLVDGADPDMATQDTRLNQSCQGGTMGLCADPSTAGLTACSSGAVVCQGPNVVKPGTVSETCNLVDDNCDGSTDEVANLVDDGGSCGTGQGACVPGTYVCQSGSLNCVGGVGAGTETCNGIDDDCNGTIDDNLGALGSCDVPPAAPPGATQPCSAGTYVCQSGALVCSGSVTAPSPVDQCGDDTNCDGQLTDQPDTTSDPQNCGSCGYDCAAEHAGSHATWDCVGSNCVATGCEFGYIDCDGNTNDCESYCPNQSGTEICNGLDDDCNCAVDDNIPPAQTPSPSSVCGVAPGATQAECGAGDGATTGILVTCSSGTWTCDFPDGFCTTVDPNTGQPSCLLTPELCNDIDDNCNGAVDEDFKYPVRTTKILDASCTSEDVYRDLQCATSGDPSCPPTAPPQGVCKGTGVYVCDGTTDTICTATFNDAARSDELCDGQDNDCDGLVDETFNNKGSDSRFVAPDVVQIGSSLWVYQYEASRPGATTTNPGSGNGYWCTGTGCSGVPAAPAGKPLEQTPACSTPDVMPWFNVTPVEVEQTCQAMGGFICDQSVWQAACEASASCTYAYGPRANCDLSSSPPSRVCNIHAFDFDGNGANGLTDGLLPTASGLLADCYADWADLQGNGASPAGRIFDLMGNLREITQYNSTTYTLMGGAFNTNAESGATCDFDFFSVSAAFQLFDTGFRCCFDSDPTQ